MRISSLSENFIRPMRSSRAAWSRNARTPFFADSSRRSSDIEPETSSTSMTLAGLRSSRQDCLIRASTREDGTVSTRSGWAGSTPLASSIGATGGVPTSAGRKPAFAATSGVSARVR